MIIYGASHDERRRWAAMLVVTMMAVSMAMEAAGEPSMAYDDDVDPAAAVDDYGDGDDQNQYELLNPLAADDMGGRPLLPSRVRERVRKVAECLRDSILNVANGKWRLPASCCKLRIFMSLRVCDPQPEPEPELPEDRRYSHYQQGLAAGLIKNIAECAANLILNLADGRLEMPSACCKLPSLSVLGFCQS